MGLLHSLVNWGIRIMDNTDTDVRRIGQRLGYMPLSWRQVVMANPTKDGLLWRAPDRDVPMANALSYIQALLVAENEQVMVLMNGKLLKGMERGVLLPPGLYDIGRMQMRDQVEIIWTTTRELRLRWGVADVLTKDRISIGASGYYSAIITDPEEFVRNVAGNAQVYKEDQLYAFAKPEVSAVLRDLIAHKTVMEFQLARQELIYASEATLQPIFARWGLEFRGLTVENQNIPEQFRQAAAGRTIISMEKEAELEGARANVTLAQLEAQKTLYLAQAQASQLRALGQVDVELMQQQMALGVDPLELKRIEAAETLAANPSESALIDNRPQAMQQILGQPLNPPGMPISFLGPVVSASSPLNPPLSTSGNLESGPLPGRISAPGSSPTSGTSSREKIQELLDKLDERLIAGEISEQKHSELSERLHKRLDELG